MTADRASRTLAARMTSRTLAARMTSRPVVLNGFGISIGDSVIGLQALTAAIAVGRFGADPRPLLVRTRVDRDFVADVYRLADFAETLWRPDTVPEDWVAMADPLIDIRDFAFDPAFRGVAMIDYFLARLGLDPDAVPASLKRNSWLAPRVAPKRPVGLPERYVLVCPGASMALRDMPEAVHRVILSRIVASQALPVVTQGVTDMPGVIAVPRLADFATLCGLVAGAERMISTDTAMVHLADAFSVPCLAVFTTHRPEWRVRDYPLCTPLHLPAAGLPEALEFSRGPGDLEALSAAWHDGLGVLESAISRKNVLF